MNSLAFSHASKTPQEIQKITDDVDEVRRILAQKAEIQRLFADVQNLIESQSYFYEHTVTYSYEYECSKATFLGKLTIPMPKDYEHQILCFRTISLEIINLFMLEMLKGNRFEAYVENNLYKREFALARTEYKNKFLFILACLHDDASVPAALPKCLTAKVVLSDMRQQMPLEVQRELLNACWRDDYLS